MTTNTLGSCRFDPRRLNMEVHPDGPVTESWQYECENCGLWHWACPVLEADGSAATAHAAVEAIKDALDRWYLQTQGVTWREVHAELGREELHVPWRPPPLEFNVVEDDL